MEQGGGLQGPWPWEQCPQGYQYSGATGQACREGGGRLAATWRMGSCCWCLAQPPTSGLRQGLGESRGPPKLGLGVLSHLRPGFPQAARPRGTRWPAQSMRSGVARLVSNLKATSLFRGSDCGGVGRRGWWVVWGTKAQASPAQKLSGPLRRRCPQLLPSSSRSAPCSLWAAPQAGL